MGRYSGKKCRLATMFGLTASFFVVEITVGHVTNSMALISDSFHMLSDIAAIIIAFLSVRMAPQSWDKNTYGWARAEVLGALVNAVFLVALCFSITMESLKRFYEPEAIHDPQLILIVGALGLVVNLLGLCLFHEHGSGHSHGNLGHVHDHGAHSHLAALADVDNEEDQEGGQLSKPESHKLAGEQVEPADTKRSGANLNMRGVFLHVMADALGSVIVIISAIVMWKTDWEYKLYVDPGLSLFMVMLMLKSVWPLLIESALILLQTVPTHLDIETLKTKLLERVDGILAIHEFHVWQLAGDRIIASAHIRCLNLSEYMKMAENIKEFFHHEGIHSTTIQPEFVDPIEYGAGQARPGIYDDISQPQLMNHEDCALACPKDPTKLAPDCEASKCCPPTSKDVTENTASRSVHNTPTLAPHSRRNDPDLDPEFDGRPSIPYVFSTSTPAAKAPLCRSANSSVVSPGPVFNSSSTSTAKSPGRRNLAEFATPGTVRTNLSYPSSGGSGLGDSFRIDTFDDSLGVAPLRDGVEDNAGLCTPRAKSRIIRTVSRHSDV